MKNLELNWRGGWQAVWERDDPWHPWGRVWLDRETGKPIWAEVDDPRADLSESRPPPEVSENPDRYEEVPCLSHRGDHSEIFREWLEAEVDDNKRAICNTVSIGGFFDTAGKYFGDAESETLRESWHKFHDPALRERATAWLRDRGWEVRWKS